MIKTTIALCFAFIFINGTYAQESVTVEWQSALGGTVVAHPKRTSYGFIMLSEGRILNAATEDGTIIWRKNINGAPSPYFSVTRENFVYITTDDAQKLSLYNPDGTFLWEAELERAAVSDPLPGRDGRVFVLEEQAISCYGSHGIRKWRIKVESSGGFGIVEMNDGSILYVTQSSNYETNMAIRISPYGTILEEIRFIDNVVTLSSYDGGAILGFSNGAIGSCAVVDGSTKTLSSVIPEKQDVFAKDIIIGTIGFCVLYSDNSIVEYSMQNIHVLWSGELSKNLVGQNVYASYIGNSYIFTSTKYVCSFYDASTQKGGLLAWEKYIQNTIDSFFPIVTRSAYLVVARPNWVVAGFKLFEDERILETTSNILLQDEKNYSTFFPEKSSQNTSVLKIGDAMQAGDYGNKELDYTLHINDVIQMYSEEYFSFINNTNIAEKSSVYITASNFQSSYFNYIVPLILSSEVDPYFIQLAFTIAKTIAYDPNEIMLRSIEEYYAMNKSLLNENTMLSLCDAVYEICLYMGRPALIARGKQILSDILQTNTSIKVQEKVGKTLYLFIQLEN